MNLTIAYHNVWEQTLTRAEKEKYGYLLGNYNSTNQSVELHPITIKRKKSSGYVATVFICNHTHSSITIETTTVKIMSPTGMIAEEEFSPKLSIPSLHAMPWSFVFSPSNVFSNEVETNGWTVHLHPSY